MFLIDKTAKTHRAPSGSRLIFSSSSPSDSLHRSSSELLNHIKMMRNLWFDMCSDIIMIYNDIQRYIVVYTDILRYTINNACKKRPFCGWTWWSWWKGSVLLLFLFLPDLVVFDNIARLSLLSSSIFPCLFVCLFVPPRWHLHLSPLYDGLDHSNHTFSESSWSNDIKTDKN